MKTFSVNSTRAECPVLQSQLNAEDIISLDSECYAVDVPNDSSYDDNKMEVLEVYGGAGCFVSFLFNLNDLSVSSSRDHLLESFWFALTTVV